MTFSNSVEERVKNMQIFSFLFAFPAPRFASQATKKGFPLYNSVTNMRADLRAHNGSRQMAENIYAIFRFCEFLGFYRLLCVGFLDQNGLGQHIGVINLAGSLAWTGSITSFLLYSYQWGASSEYLSQLIPDLPVLVHYTDGSLSLSLHLLRFRPEYGIFDADCRSVKVHPGEP